MSCHEIEGVGSPNQSFTAISSFSKAVFLENNDKNVVK
mgnify:CR=1 FL=1